MSKEFDTYLDNLPIMVIKLTDSSTIIARFIEDDGQQTLVCKPMEMEVIQVETGKAEIIMQEWLYGCDTHEVIIDNDKIITYAEANRKLKNFYSKCMLQEKLSDMVENIGKDIFLSHADFISSFIAGLEPKDSTKDEDILSPWRDRFEWRPKADSPKRDEDDDLPF
jgi:hypothetical protein